MTRNVLRNKLQDESGVSILIALLLLLVAAIISCVILNAATTSLNVIHDDYESTQAQLTLDSAGKLVKDELTGFEVQVKKRGTTNTYTVVAGDSYEGSHNKTGLRGVMADAFKAVYSSDVYTESYPYVSSDITFASSNSALNTVTAKLVMYKDELDPLDSSVTSYPATLTLLLDAGGVTYSEELTIAYAGSNNDLHSWADPEIRS